MSENEHETSAFEAPPLRARYDADEAGDEQPLEAADTPEPEPEPDATQPQAPTPEEMEARFRKAERATKTYVASITRIFEDEAKDLIECPLCLEWARGYIHPQSVGNFTDEQRQAAGFILNGIEQVAYSPSPHHQTCGVCDGYGVVRTGSKVAGNDTATCDACAGYGYTPPPAQAVQPANGHADFHAPAGERSAPVATDDRDSWGEPRKLPDGRDNPNYGRMPHHKVTVEPYGITAGLGLQPAAAA